MSQFLEILKSGNALRQVVGFQNIRRAIGFNLSCQIVDTPASSFRDAKYEAQKILVLSPHPDDDVFGCGGTIFKHAQDKDQITVLYLTDGSRGTPQGIRDSSLIIKRRKEAEEAAKILGVKELLFWGYSDGRLEATKTTRKAMFNLLLDLKPDIVYLPSFLDTNKDHFVTSQIFYSALDGLANTDFEIWSYEIWSPSYINRLVSIDFGQKEEAIKAHATQLKCRDYLGAIRALNEYRAKLPKIDKPMAEGFFACGVELYKDLFKRLI